MDRIAHAKTLAMIEGDFFGSGKLPPAYVGPFLVQHSWEVIEDRVATANAV
jgi:hypothetical protein